MPVSLNCAHCGVLFTTTKQQAKDGRKYCSSTCYRDREKVNGPRKLVVPVAFACKQCGDTFYRDPGELASYRKKFGRDPFYCSTTCSGTGRSTAKVHHVNGVKTDNRIENLELFDSRHGPGQRVTDQVAFAISILTDYADFAQRAGFKLVKID